MLTLPFLMALEASRSASVNAHRSKPRQDILRANLDTAVKPGVDFFEYANGGWLKRNPIPASESSWGIANLVRDELYKKLRNIDEVAARAHGATGSDSQKVGDFWVTAMDSAKAERVGLTPLKPELARIDAIGSIGDCVDVAFELQRVGVETLFGFSVSQDEKDSDRMAVHLWQGGLGLPDRDYYFNPAPAFAKIRSAYVKNVEGMLELAGAPNAAQSAATVLAFETGLAGVSRKLEDLRDPQRNYNKLTTADVQQTLTPSIQWRERLEAWKLRPPFVIVGQPEFYSGLEALLAKTPLSTIRDYMRFHLISRYAPYLNKKADSLDFHFNHEVLSGQKQPQPRWKRVLRAENEAIGFVLGRIFVKEYFPPSAKKRYSDLVEAIRAAYSARIDRLDWMSAATKAKAHQKLAALRKKVGYPDKWKDYSKLLVGRASYCDNMMNAARWQFDDMLSKFGKPVDRTEWGMTPQTYNAYYDPSNNEIVLPAAAFAIPGLKDSQIDEALMYGYAGASYIGHEMTHGFDDEGRQYDAKGNLADWWTKEDARQFQQRAEVMVKQFNAYEPLPGMHINGKASLGENIADYGGLLLGLDAFKKTAAYKNGRKIAGLTPLQRFYLGYALSWLDETREASLRRQLVSDVHAPAKWRVNGPLSNIPNFFSAFGIKPGQPMRRPSTMQVHIW
ncbi:MAG: M13 family metallopeptidase [Fimbriimonadaceae bacterium]